jgi:hypothetical protein
VAVTLVQQAQNTTHTGAATLAVGSAQGWATPTAGNLLVGWAIGDTTASVSGWTAGPSIVNNNAVYFFYKTAAGTETTVTFTSGPASALVVGVLEYSGASGGWDVRAAPPPGRAGSPPRRCR